MNFIAICDTSVSIRRIGLVVPLGNDGSEEQWVFPSRNDGSEKHKQFLCNMIYTRLFWSIGFYNIIF